MNDKVTFLKQELALVESELRQIQGELDSLHTRQWQTGEAKQRKQRDLIREMGLLKNVPWRVRPCTNRLGFYLDGGDDQTHQELVSIAAHDWHCNLQLRYIDEHDYIDLRFDDGDITITAVGEVSKDQFVEFIEDWGLPISTAGIEESISNLRQQADNLQALVDLF